MPDRHLSFLLHGAQRSLFGYVDRMLKQQLGIGSAQPAALHGLARRDGRLLTELSDGPALNNSAVTGAVNRMRPVGLLITRRSPTGGRALQGYLTVHGRELGARSRPLPAELDPPLAAASARPTSPP